MKGGKIMLLYEYPQIMLEFSQWVEDENPSNEEIQQRLSAIDLDFEETIDHIVSMARELALEADAIKQTANTLKERETQKRSKCERLKAIAKETMLSAGKEKIETPRNKIWLQTNPPSVVIENESEFIAKHGGQDYVEESIGYHIDKKMIKEMIQDGYTIEGAELRQEKGLRIK